MFWNISIMQSREKIFYSIKEHDGKVSKLLKKGQKSFDQSPVGDIHHQLHKWFEDKDVLLKT
ncbi:hypothetical protein KUTeg_024384 [Tegillarca granosa]|uniref:Uncharacterized protein n=1 Tax=Tegillarca granosa TaxID=220873 RepID=A0ABQ9E3I0_TEGGR|nr:hypothetical protein KUTeg_024384 [Tegillarca granosa]